MFPLILKSRWVLEVLWSTAWACQPYHRVTDPQSQCYLQLWNMKCSYLSSINTIKRGPIWILYLSIPCNMANLEGWMSQTIMTVGSYQKLKWICSRYTWISFNHFLEVIYSLFAPGLSKNTNSIHSWKKKGLNLIRTWLVISLSWESLIQLVADMWHYLIFEDSW